MPPPAITIPAFSLADTGGNFPSRSAWPRAALPPTIEPVKRRARRGQTKGAARIEPTERAPAVRNPRRDKLFSTPFLSFGAESFKGFGLLDLGCDIFQCT